MGVRGLMHYCNQHEALVSTICEDLHDVTLAVDFVGFLFHVCELLYQEVHAEGNVSAHAWLLLGGCPDRLETWMTDWLAQLRAAKISLVFIADPPQCFGGKDHRKGYCLLDRSLQKAERIDQLVSTLFESQMVPETASVLESAVHGRDPEQIKHLRLAESDNHVTRKLLQQTNGCFPFAREKLRGILKKHGIPIKTAVREADEELADLVRIQRAFAVLGHDSDFLCMRGIRYIPFASLMINKKRKTISARVFTPELVAQSLGLEEDQLVDLAIMCSNDLTPLLDNEYNMATKLNFPVQRTQSTGNFYPKAAATWIKGQLKLLDNPVLAQIEAEKRGFLRSLYEIYRFYGHSGAFLKKYPLTIEPALPKNKVNTYRKLLERFEYPPVAIDVLETQSRNISQRFDLFLVLDSEGKTVNGLLAEIRQLLYHALNVLTVREVEAGDQYYRTIQLKRHDFMTTFLSTPLHSRPAKLIDQMLRWLVFSLLYKSEHEAKQASSICGSLGKADRKGMFIKTAVYSLLLFWKYDGEYLHNHRVLHLQRLEMFLLTSMICLHMKLSKKPRTMNISSTFDGKMLNWGVYASVAGYVEIMKHIFQLRVVLGEKIAPTAGCATMFSAEVFVIIYHSLTNGGTKLVSDDKSLSRAEVQAIATIFMGEHIDCSGFWQEFSRTRAVLHQLRKLAMAQVIPERFATHKFEKIPAVQARSLINVEGKIQIRTNIELSTSGSFQSSAQTNGVCRSIPTCPPPSTVLPPVPPSLPPVVPSFVQAAPQPTGKIVAVASSSQTEKKVQVMKNLIPSAVAKRQAPKMSSKSGLYKASSSNGVGSMASNDGGAVSSAKQSSKLGLRGLMETLPVFAHREEILRNVMLNQLTIIQGETGCGKSTSVPQFLHDAWARGETSDTRPVNIYVTQPRRIAAIELANTVARMREGNEFGEDGIVGNIIGYRIGQKQCISKNTKITYVTTGYMVERLIHDSDALMSITHLILDEVHERSMDVDLLLLLLKLKLREHPHLRLVIMSATMDAKVLIKYFGNALSSRLIMKKPLFVGSKLFPVENVYLDDFQRWFPNIHTGGDFAFLRNQFDKLVQSRANPETAALAISRIHDKQMQLIVEMVRTLIMDYRSQQKSQCILIFVPGINSINALYETFSTMIQATLTEEIIHVFVLHSGLELEHQQQAFVTPDQKSTKIIISTNIAESSVTIPDVTHVINTGIEKRIEMPNADSSHAEVLVDAWCSRASAKQRAGRSGRVMPGIAFHLFSEAFMEENMAEFSTPEILRKPLDRIVLQLKGKLDQFGVPSVLLEKALDAPDLSHIEGAYKLLAHFGAINSEFEKDSQMTKFGAFVCRMPLSLQLCQLLMAGTYLAENEGKGTKSWRLLLHVVIVVAILAVPDLYIMPSFYHARSSIEYMKEMKYNLKAKVKTDDGQWSEPLAIWRLYLNILMQRKRKNFHLSTMLWNNSISSRRFQTLNFLISDLCSRLIALSKRSDDEFGQLLDSKSVEMLQKLDAYASSRVPDNSLIEFASESVGEKRHEEQILRFLIVQNFSEHLIGSGVGDPAKFSDDDLQDMDRVDLKLDKEHKAAFAPLTNKQRITLFEQLSGSANPLDEFAAIAYEDQIVSLYPYATSRNEKNDVGGNSQLLDRMSFPVSLMYYICDQRFPIDFGMRNAEYQEEMFRFRIVKSNSSALSWKQKKDGVKVSIGGRSLFALPIRPTSMESLLAVYADRLFTGDETRMFCSKCTLLPPNSVGYYPMMLLVSANRKANIWLHVNVDTDEIVTVKVDGQVAVLPPKTALSLNVIQRINQVRRALSNAMNGEVNGERISVSSLLSLSDDEAYIVKGGKSSKSNRFAWRQLRIVAKDDKKVSGMISFFPELHLV